MTLFGLNQTPKKYSFLPFSNQFRAMPFEDTHREKDPQMKLQSQKSVSMDIWVVGTSNQLFLKGF